MAVGMDDRSKSVDAVINILERCRQMAKPGPSCVQKQTNSPAENDCNTMPDGSQWPHCQHYLSEDEPVDPLGQSIELIQYKDETNLADIMRLMTKDLSEPYSIYTYRFFVHSWPELCILAYDKTRDAIVGAVVGKVETQTDNRKRGYIAMLAIDASLRRQGLGTKLVSRAIRNMQHQGCDEVYLETEVDNLTAQGLYSKLGFIRDKRLIRYYLNGKDAFRLKLFFTLPSPMPPPEYC
ncbi:unnamed protein product [Auanema sp. JU1783]|nr:unnamed protein product [Auanema sp. JU1783]